MVYVKNQTVYGVFLTRERERLEEMNRAIEQGLLRPVISDMLPLEEVGRAHERLDTGHGTGKIVLRVAES